MLYNKVPALRCLGLAILLSTILKSSGLAKNVAVGKSSSSNSICNLQQPSGCANNAVDGSVDEGNCFGSAKSINQWWKVDLSDKYFIVGAVVYNLGVIGGRLQKASLLVGNSDTDPNPTRAGWTKIADQDTVIRRDRPNNCFEYNSYLDEAEPVPLARYVAVYSTHSDGLAISEVIVFGIGKSDMKVTSLTADESEVGCVTISWQPPITGSIVDYQVKYGDDDWISITDRSPSHRKCGLSTYYTMNIQIKVDGVSESQSIQISKPCADPSKPKSIIDCHEKVSEDGIDRWKYTFSWQVTNNGLESHRVVLSWLR